MLCLLEGVNSILSGLPKNPIEVLIEVAVLSSDSGRPERGRCCLKETKVA